MNNMQASLIPSTGTQRRTVWVVFVALALGACQANKDEPVAESATTAPVTVKAESRPSEAPPASQPTLEPQDAFWNALSTLCDKSFAGQLTIGTEESDRAFGFAKMIMHSKRCSKNAIDIGFKVDDDDSRTWMFRRTDTGLSLHHRHVDENGKPDATSGYGGMTSTQGTAVRQEFQADANTGTMIPAAATNVWAIEITPGETYAYELQRIEQQRMFRVVFDLTTPVSR